VNLSKKIKDKALFIILIISIPLVIVLSIVIYLFSNIHTSILTSSINYSSKNQIDSNLLKGFSYSIKGKDGEIIALEKSLSFLNKKIILSDSPLSFPKIDFQVISGTNDPLIVQELVKSNFSSLIDALKKGTKDQISVLTDTSENLSIDKSSKLDNINFFNFQTQDPNKSILSNQLGIKVGTLSVKLNNCNKELSLEVDYFINTKSYKFVEIKSFLSQLCVKVIPPPLVATCIDCDLFPVDKQFALSNNYIPQVTIVDSIPGGAFFSIKAKPDLIDLYVNASKAGNPFTITSGYRSYNTQIGTFNAWVTTEIQKGFDKASAIINANNYSAYPGHSEHQLGTTLDITAVGCLTFNKSCHGNIKLRNWMSSNGYLYGFSLSYPENKQNLTGYVYEPWHYRWIGRDLAKQYNIVEHQTYLAEFLRNEVQNSYN